ncbi:MAG: 4Fe-4S dicluster domain-containing protein, partial [Verrucomicrobia bacterium]|nr:4Fe-4S dicluster domain-containing protein [Verrucomicrobiota bacterium]
VIILGKTSLLDALKEAPSYLAFAPFSLELIDKKIIEFGLSSPLMHNRLQFLHTLPEALVLIECPVEQADALLAHIKKKDPLFVEMLEDKETVKAVWDLRKLGLGLLLSKKSYSQAVAFIEDITVPIDHVAPFIEEIQALLTQAGKEAGIYGHLGVGCLHIRPYFDTRNKQELKLIEEMMDKAMKLVTKYGGILSGEHGDGLTRSWTTEKMFGSKIFEAFTRLKMAFDPHDRMNPGKIVGTSQPLLDNLKRSPTTKVEAFQPFFDFSREGGLAMAIDMCNGNGACRKKEGVMCPSFQVTHDEKDSTRARANALQALIHGRLHAEAIATPEFHEVMDLCIQCKGCKTECPSQIDMAKLKSEYLHQLHQKKGAPLRDRLFASIPSLFRLASSMPRLANWVTTKISKFFGIAEERPLPQLATSRFSTLFKRHKKNQSNSHVVLFVDTFTEFTAPSIGMDAVKVLEALGLSVIAPDWHCCGRTLISKGFLPEAKKKLEYLVNVLYPYAEKGLQIVGLEPSCILTLVDEVRDFGLDAQKVAAISKASRPIDEFLFDYIDQLAALTSPYPGSVQLHGHCHQKSLVGIKAQCEILKKLTAKEVTVIPSGCCGMAGSFGYEKEHAHFSQQIGELVLFPHIRACDPDTIIIASGTSCRAQIEVGTKRHALHLVEFIALLLRSNDIKRPKRQTTQTTKRTKTT